MAPARPLRRSEPVPVLPAEPMGALAVALADLARNRDGLIHVAPSERRAERLAGLLEALAPDLEVLAFPPWDCLPFERASPSRAVMGQRAATLGRLAQPASEPRLLVTVADALLQRVPPPETWEHGTWTLAAGDPFDLADLEAHLRRTGYVVDERVDEAGEVAFRGEVIDICPGAAEPCRIEHADGRVTAIRAFDPVTQRTTGELERVIVGPASEVVIARGGEEPAERLPGMEHRLGRFYPRLDTVFDYLPRAAVVLEPRAQERLDAAFEQIEEGHENRLRLAGQEDGSGAVRRPGSPDALYLDRDAWSAALRGREILRPAAAEAAIRVPRFAGERHPARVLAAFLRRMLEEGRRVVLAGTGPARRALLRAAERAASRPAEPVADWPAALEASEGALLVLDVDLEAGFADPASGTVVVAATDLLGSRARVAEPSAGRPGLPGFGTEEFRLGDAVIHIEHGVGTLEGIERLRTGEDEGDVLRLEYAGGAKLLVPVDEIGRIWRYGADAGAVSLDRLDGEAWAKRKEKVEAEIAEAAGRLVALARERAERQAPKLDPPSRGYERFAARFPFSETPDQAAAIADVLADLASGRPMDRLVVGDVGFGKTEVALRAAAAAALCGKQVALAAPTTVLVRQHLATFKRRFAGLGIEVAGLSRLAKPAEARRVKAGLKDGSIRIVVGTQALAGQGVAFQDLGLVIIDEEQRFGTAHKSKLRGLARGGVHVLTLTATPIPRTFLSAMVGIQDASVIATPPARRRPIRTFVSAFDPATMRDALTRERRRGGQSFVVCPRIEDIEPLRARLAELVPELETLVAHGGLPADEVDATMVRFADGDGDVLLATNIIESGLDVPRANTMLVWRADRFGLAQLHQLRGRVGRGRAQGIAYLLTEPGAEIAPATRKRLDTLATLDRLGAGFAVSAQDLDQRGAGDLFGEEQAGHMRLIGAGLYRHLLGRALAAARGGAPEEDWAPVVNAGAAGLVPEEYVPEPDLRVNLYARLFGAESAREVDALADEIEDRFGPLPEPVAELVARLRLGILCRAAGVARLDAGPQGIALTFRPGALARPAVEEALAAMGDELGFKGERLVLSRATETPAERRDLAVHLLETMT